MTVKKINIQKNIEGLLNIIKLPKAMENFNIPSISEPENYMVIIDDNGNELIREYNISDLSIDFKSIYDEFMNLFSDSDTCQIIIDLEDSNKRLIINKSNSFIDISKQTIMEYNLLNSNEQLIFDAFISKNNI